MNVFFFVVLVYKCCAIVSASSGIVSNSSTAINMYNISPTAAVQGLLPEYEVSAINKLFQSLRTTSSGTGISMGISASSCGSINRISCTCDIDEICHIHAIYGNDLGLSGKIPEELGNLSQLQYLDVSQNKLTGVIPRSFFKLWNLIEINLDNNLLQGFIPPSFGNLTALTSLKLSNNLFSGPIPEEMINIRRLRILYLYNNQLSGLLPPGLGNLRDLEYLSLQSNYLTGRFPPSIKQLQSLQYFNVRGNKLSGKIPEDIGNWKNMSRLTLLGNNFEGPLPRAISTLTHLKALGVSDLIATDREKIQGYPFPDISQMTNLKFLTLRNCNIEDRIPPYIFHMPLYYLELSFNSLTGDIPDPYFAQTPMQLYTQTPIFIFLRRNKLNGTFPEWLIGKRESLVDVSENSFTAIKPLPASISENLNLFEYANNKSNMTDKWQVNPYTCQHELHDKEKYSDLFINCGGEKMQVYGYSYEADLNPNGGATFFLSENERWGYSSMGTSLNDKQDSFLANMSTTDSTLYSSARQAPIFLKYFGFCLKNGIYRVRLHYAEIVFDAGSKARRVFDVEIQGMKVESDFNIADEAGGVNKNITKEYTNIHVNNSRLEIHLFWTGMGLNGPLISAISATRGMFKSVEKKHNKLSPLAISGIVEASLLLPLLVLLILWRKGYFGGKNPELEEIKAELQGKFFNFHQIKAATQNFSSDNKLGDGGFGSVFKGILPDGTAIAVKQFSARSMQGIREFVNEIGTVSALQHPNLVKLLGCCAEDSQRLLIYEYMENNSLHHALFVSEELKKRLDWATRVRVCHGIAKGLAFLHEESELKVVHRDIKPTNILLDKDLTAKISDFGFAKLYEGEATHIITRIAGTTGYMAPEYAMRGHLTYKADVYSFGVVLLEIVSGKNSASYIPNDQSVYLLDLACVLQKEGNLIELVDPALEDYSWDEANTILNLALLCTDRSYTLRPTMSEVVKILEKEYKISNYTIGDHYSMDDSVMAAGLSQSTYSGSTSHAGNSAVSTGNSRTSGKESSSTEKHSTN